MTAPEFATRRALLDTTAELRRILGAHLLRQSSLSPTDFQVLVALHEADTGQLRSSELAATIDWERSRLSHRLGWLRDHLHPESCSDRSAVRPR